MCEVTQIYLLIDLISGFINMCYSVYLGPMKKFYIVLLEIFSFINSIILENMPYHN